MAESTLSLKYGELAATTGFMLGYGRGNTAPYTDPAWSAVQAQNVEDCLRNGQRMLLYPPILEGEGASHDWSFLRPVCTLSLPAGSQYIHLPDDFGSWEGQIQLAATMAQAWFPINVTGVGQILKQYTLWPSASGRPELACVEPIKGTSATAGQRFQMHFWPQADTTYTLQGQYYVNPDAINFAFPYTLGGSAHAETYREACLAAAERFLDDSMSVHDALFKERLAASVSIDRRGQAQTFGPNLDRSTHGQYSRQQPHGWGNGVRINGVLYA